jgi:hypothetical protein
MTAGSAKSRPCAAPLSGVWGVKDLSAFFCSRTSIKIVYDQGAKSFIPDRKAETGDFGTDWLLLMQVQNFLFRSLCMYHVRQCIVVKDDSTFDK